MKAARKGIRMGDLLHPETLAERIQLGYDEVRILLGDSAALAPLATITEDLVRLSQPLLPLIGNAQDYLWQAWRAGESILFEGAQATLLDIDHGTYPYVTSSNCSIGGLFTGTGLPPKVLDHVLGVAKAYTTRVGAGPFPSELLDATGEQLRQVGREFGTTTGRPRRCGWFDAPITAHACRTNGVDGLAIMKLDVLDGMDEVGLIVGYRSGEGTVSTQLPSCAADWLGLQPVVKQFKGWASTRGITEHSQLPAPAQAYLEALAESVAVPIVYLSTGPDRSEGCAYPGTFLEPLLQA
jgi:adenylosuccinate synthase